MVSVTYVTMPTYTSTNDKWACHCSVHQKLIRVSSVQLRCPVCAFTINLSACNAALAENARIHKSRHQD